VHIVHLIARLNDGGPARVVAMLAQALSARGHRVTVLAGSCQDGERDLSAELRLDGVEVETIPGLARRLHPLADARSLALVIARLRALRPALVHSHTAKAGTLARLACRWLHLPCLHTYHGHVLRGYFARAPAMAAWLCERLVAGNAHHQALTASQLGELSTRLGIGRRRRWHCLAIPVEVPVRAVASWQQRLLPGVPVIGYLGRFAAVKDPLLWLEALARLGSGRAVQGLMCGDGALRASCEARAAALGVRVVFTGFVPAGEALAACAVLLMTSRNEGLPLAALEAGGLGVPVVAPAVGGLADLVGMGAVEGARRTPQALAEACLGLLADGPRRQRRITAASALARSLAPATLAPAYEELYRAIIPGGT
jgi:glycosyltransferase involved in cell wall biosynthesis